MHKEESIVTLGGLHIVYFSQSRTAWLCCSIAWSTTKVRGMKVRGMKVRNFPKSFFHGDDARYRRMLVYWHLTKRRGNSGCLFWRENWPHRGPYAHCLTFYYEAAWMSAGDATTPAGCLPMTPTASWVAKQDFKPLIAQCIVYFIEKEQQEWTHTV